MGSLVRSRALCTLSPSCLVVACATLTLPAPISVLICETRDTDACKSPFAMSARMPIHAAHANSTRPTPARHQPTISLVDMLREARLDAACDGDMGSIQSDGAGGQWPAGTGLSGHGSRRTGL